MELMPEIFVDAFGEISFKHGMIRIELVSLSGPEPRVLQRLITSLQAFSQMLQTQNGMMEHIKKPGMMRPPHPAPQAEATAERDSVGAVRRLALIDPAPQPASIP